jgi:hypothetical protein
MRGTSSTPLEIMFSKFSTKASKKRKKSTGKRKIFAFSLVNKAREASSSSSGMTGTESNDMPLGHELTAVECYEEFAMFLWDLNGELMEVTAGDVLDDGNG